MVILNKTKNTPTPEQYAWLAGLIEGEGTFTLRMMGKYGPYPEICVQMTDLDVLEKAKEWFGGNLNGPYQNKNLRVDGSLRKGQYKWAINEKRLILQISLGIKPWMGSRRMERLQAIIDYLESLDDLDPGYKRDEAHKKLMSLAKKGQTHSPEVREKMRQAALKRWNKQPKSAPSPPFKWNPPKK